MAELLYQDRPDDLKLGDKFAQVLDPKGPPPVKMMAAKGIVPGASPGDLLHVLFALTFDPNEQVAEGAGKSLAETPGNIVKGAINDESHPGVIDFLVRSHIEDEDLLEFLVLRKQVHDQTLIHVARSCPHLKIVEIVGKNQERLIVAPGILDALKENPVTPKSLVDVTTTFLQMAGVLPTGVEARSQGLPEEIDRELVEALLEDEDEFDEVLTQEQEEGDSAELAEQAKKNILDLTVPQKIKLAYKANKETRTILLRDSNKLVLRAVLNSGRLTESEAVSLAKNRSVDSEILKTIANDRDFRKRYEIKLNLSQNPKTPQAIALRILGELRVSDLKSLSRNRNVPGVVSQQAKRLADKKTGTRS